MSVLETLFLILPLVRDYHAPQSMLYALLRVLARSEIEKLFSDGEGLAKGFGPFGDLILPYHRMGAIDSLNLFDLAELIIFSFYWTNRKRYRHVLDLGANIGLHSIILGKCGFDVCAYEPDPQHFEILQRNLVLNNCSNVQTFNAAVSSKAGVMEFVRVLGNLTASHLTGSKSNPYGELERLPVKVEAIEPLIIWADLIKIDVEGHEKEILLATHHENWLTTDALVEVENGQNALDIYHHFMSQGVNLFSQKTNWQLVCGASDMPASYREGMLFVTCKDEMPWS